MDSKFSEALRLHQAGQLSQAERAYRKILAKTPNDVTVLYHLGVVLHQQQKNEDARRTLVKTVAKAPDFPEAHQSLGLVLLDLQRKDKAEDSFRRAIALRPDMGKAQLRLAELYLEQKRYSDVLPLLKRLSESDSCDAPVLKNLSHVYRELGQLDMAIEIGFQLLGLEATSGEHSLQLANTIYLLFQSEPELARAYARRWLSDFPNSTFAHHACAAVLGNEVPARANDDYVKHLFDSFSGSFETQLAKLGYSTNNLIESLAELDSMADMTILDAGCGTGLAAAALRPAASRLIGVDLSSGMLAKAREKGLYDELVEMELCAYLRENQLRFDLIVASDVLNYFGALENVFLSAWHALLPGGQVIFSLECSGDEVESYGLAPHGRYLHHKDYIQQALVQAGFSVTKLDTAVLRTELGQPVNGYLVKAVKLA